MPRNLATIVTKSIDKEPSLVLAMSHHQLGEPAKARAAFDEALASMKTQSHQPERHIQFLHALRDEAAALLQVSLK